MCISVTSGWLLCEEIVCGQLLTIGGLGWEQRRYIWLILEDQLVAHLWNKYNNNIQMFRPELGEFSSGKIPTRRSRTK